MKDSEWDTLAQRRTIARLYAFFKAYCGERAWKAIRDRLQRCFCLNSVDRVQKMRDRKQRNNIGNCSFANWTIKNCNELPAEALGTFPCKQKASRNRDREAVMDEVK